MHEIDDTNGQITHKKKIYELGVLRPPIIYTAEGKNEGTGPQLPKRIFIKWSKLELRAYRANRFNYCPRNVDISLTSANADVLPHKIIYKCRAHSVGHCFILTTK
ncbi:hypothetical protein GWI33_020947 [Rhynchophorus ferrugineus]|uniref:Uncharacterized protein n=1 Tax=Rhynchophorus ferrugineus TaxID=354439 RepID=A0A834HQK9_RHYFE|nr:hypothetical protein GWI33_020947 [Rhynchophorus ferrugineus]